MFKMESNSLFLKQLSVYGGKRAAFTLMKFISQQLPHITSLEILQQHLQHCDKVELSCTFQQFLQDNCYSLTPLSFSRINAFLLQQKVKNHSSTETTIAFTPILFRDVLKEYRMLNK